MFIFRISRLRKKKNKPTYGLEWYHAHREERMKKKVNLTKLITIEMLDILPIRSFKAFERCLFQGMKLILSNL